MIHQGEYRQVHKAELSPIELSSEEKKAALNQMLRLQILWGQLEQLAEAQVAREVIKVISVKSLPRLNRIENSLLTTLEREVAEILTESLELKDNTNSQK